MDNGNNNPLNQSGQQFGQNVNNFNGMQDQNVINVVPPRPSQPIQPTQPGVPPIQRPGQFGQPTAPTPAQTLRKDYSGIIKTICLIFTSLLAVGFLVLFVMMYINWDTVKTDVDGQIERAVAEAENELKDRMETEFAEREKNPYKTFAGPTDFGALTFEYPKTWSVYVPEDASRAGDFHAYFNPSQVNVVEDETVMALRVSILNTLTEEVKEDYAGKVEDGEMSLSSRVVNGANVDIYTGLLDSGYQGIVCVFKIRDKTAVVQTDAMIFANDFYKLVETIRFNA
ncbi:hypothetical protein IJI76_01320 [Candidatus Saccharibacteria bacterium]|nr:hypothetical protein [Candidatus Saccharibacteria bacterium]